MARGIFGVTPFISPISILITLRLREKVSLSYLGSSHGTSYEATEKAFLHRGTEATRKGEKRLRPSALTVVFA